jgi:hypothetical protein
VTRSGNGCSTARLPAPSSWIEWILDGFSRFGGGDHGSNRTADVIDAESDRDGADWDEACVPSGHDRDLSFAEGSLVG